MRLIDADDLIYMEYGGIEFVPTEFIKEAQAIDAVPVVWCKDCKWYKTNYRWDGSEVKICAIEAYEPIRKENDYCSRGERRADNDRT